MFLCVLHLNKLVINTTTGTEVILNFNLNTRVPGFTPHIMTGLLLSGTLFDMANCLYCSSSYISLADRDTSLTWRGEAMFEILYLYYQDRMPNVEHLTGLIA